MRYLVKDEPELTSVNRFSDQTVQDKGPLAELGVVGERASILVEEHVFSAFIDAVDVDSISGWAISRSDKALLFDVAVFVDGVYFGTTQNGQPRNDLEIKGLSAGQGGFRLPLATAFADGKLHDVALKLPDGSFTTTKKLRAGLRVDLPQTQIQAGTVSPDAVAVIVPVYNAFDDLQECVERLQNNSLIDTSIIFVDDKSTDERIVPFLNKLAESDPRVTTICNFENCGFSNTVNRGIQAAGSSDVVILNSDARVTPGWLESIFQAARSRLKVATVTPLSDNAGAFSAPDIGRKNAMPAGTDEREIAVAIRRRSDRVYPEVPTGNGFCMFISRASIDAVGLFDAEAFPRGYGEENDFCMRARRAGWIHLMDDSTYVFHERSASFGDSKAELIAQGRLIVDERYPEYSKLTPVFRSSTIDLVRYRVRQAIEDVQNRLRVLPRALYVYSTQSGGTPQTNRDLMLQLGDQLETWTLRCDRYTLFLERFDKSGSTAVVTYKLAESIGPLDHRSTEYDRVVHSWLRKYDIALMHIRHLGWHSLGLPEAAASLKIPVILSFHDFYSVCPSLNLLDEKQRYCGGSCTAGVGTCSNPLWAEDSLPPLKHRWVHRWRELQAEVFPFCSAFITTSESARSVIETTFPVLDGQIQVIPHGRTIPITGAAYTPAGAPGPIRILLPGNIGVSKGLNVIHELLAIDGGRTLEFHVLGTIRPENVRPGMVVHGSYNRDDTGKKISEILPTLAGVFSIWDETWCHTLTEMWAAGVPTIVFDFGTLKARMQECGGGWVFSHEDPALLLQQIVDAIEDTEGYARRREAVALWQRTTGQALNSANMGARYFDIYRSLLSDPVKPARYNISRHLGQERDSRVAVVCPADTCQQRAPASTHIRIWSRTRSTLDSRNNYFRCTLEQFLAGIQHGEIKRAIIQRNVIPSRSMPLVLKAIDEDRLRVLYDIDDDLLDVPVEKDPKGGYREGASTLCELIKRASIVTVSTPRLLAKISALNPRAELLPNLLDELIWGGVDPKRFERDSGKVVAMYMGSRTHDADLDLILPAFEAACCRVPNLYLKIVGGFESIPEDMSNRVELVDIPSVEKSYPEFVRFLETVSKDVDFALAPLLETPFNACKSELKILEYAGLGLSGLFSKVDVYRCLTHKLRVGRLVNEDVESWADAIVDAALEKRQLHSEGLMARELVLNDYSIANSLEHFEHLVESLIEIPVNETGQHRKTTTDKERSLLNGNR